MNVRIVIHHLGILVMVIAATMLLPLGWSLYFGEVQAALAFLKSIAAGVVLGGGACWATRRTGQEVFRKEALAIVGLGWLVTAGIGSLPYLFSGLLASPVDAYFESMSGFTTTGSTVLTDIAAQGASLRSVLFWRSLTHWLGGMGIIVLFVAVLPYLGAGGKHLYRTEAPGPVPEGLRPRIQQTAALLWKIYIAMTVAETIALMICIPGPMALDMRLYEGLCHTFGTLATGGFSTRNLSIAAYDSVSVEFIVIIFMIMAGMNFSLHFRLWGGDWRAYHRDAECRVYFGVIGGATLVVTLALWASGFYSELGKAFRYAVFQVVSIATTTGYGTDDFNKWPALTKVLLVALMFVGGSAGSTGGGLKVIRWLTLVKAALLQIERVYRPRTVRQARIGSVVIGNELILANVTFLGIAVGVFVLASIAMAAIIPETANGGFSERLVTAVTSVAATLNNIGPGLERVGSIGHFAFIPASGKILLSLCMAMGRLELYSILVLFLPAFWRSK